MITFSLSLLILILGYFFYSKYIERIFGIDKNRPTPAITMTDGVDYIPMPWWKVFLITLLPAIFMTAVVSTYIFLAPEGFHLSKEISFYIGGTITIFVLILFVFYLTKFKRKIISN